MATKARRQRINGLIEDCAFRDDRIKELTESHRQVYDTGHEATQRAETAESQLAQIAEALDIEHVIQAGLTPEAEAVEEVATKSWPAEPMVAVPVADLPDPVAVDVAEAPATEG